MAPGRAESDFGLQGWIDTRLKQIFSIFSVRYVKVFYTVSSTNRIFSAKNNLHALRANIEETRVTKTLGTVMVGFAFCWLPVCIIDYVEAAYRVPTLPRQVYPIYGFLIYFSSTTNPFIYGATNRHFLDNHNTGKKKTKTIIPFLSLYCLSNDKLLWRRCTSA